MKKLLILSLILISGSAMAQATYGLKGGLNYGATGEYEDYGQVIGDASTVVDGKEKTGYHLGAFAKLEFLGIFLQPELVYTRLNTDYGQFDYNLDKIDAPVLVGIHVLGPLNIKAGPSFQYILKNELENTNLSISDVENEISVGYQVGLGIELGNLGFDARYEGAFEENNAFGQAATDQKFKIDSRPSQWILSVSYTLN
ncbi:outer membrane protein with beta-barrel domain [Gillisia sp. Hel_I_86]|uniref:outer membrane beta-barrel protein n=1 Tax=Gillisia sp. Hel_I_86 TaxID=1249981 RepID=UPI00119B8154|nr:outer membrane beta-barrel protein [Gillisia sp. Hel_I_86]TVZ27467.1 outer membrane protein with beta-barrel domain [Gillisia sp. Hel_I_86]